MPNGDKERRRRLSQNLRLKSIVLRIYLAFEVENWSISDLLILLIPLSLVFIATLVEVFMNCSNWSS